MKKNEASMSLKSLSAAGDSYFSVLISFNLKDTNIEYNCTLATEAEHHKSPSVVTTVCLDFGYHLQNFAIFHYFYNDRNMNVCPFFLMITHTSYKHLCFSLGSWLKPLTGSLNTVNLLSAE